ncbi:hypothetical protein [Erwinia amylovora]|uniref:hypothetical protein n=1 Tax=Erwinia amylovora TaxID=552 RepID=UPI00144480FF|nr:hypothetical protein [Erwinia amylovora]
MIEEQAGMLKSQPQALNKLNDQLIGLAKLTVGSRCGFIRRRNILPRYCASAGLRA